MAKPWTSWPWLHVSRADLETERRQAADEGRDLAPVAAEFDRLAAADLDDPAAWPDAEALLARVQSLPLRPDYPYHEPCDPAGIRAALPADGPLVRRPALSAAAMEDRMLGAWLGRCAGCLAGKPVEGRKRRGMERILRAQGRWPLAHYWSRHVEAEVAQEEGWFSSDGRGPAPDTVIEGLTGMPEDDDTNYTAAGYAILERHGADFAPADVAGFWLQNLPIGHVCTAERVAYRNLVRLIPPPGPDGSVDGQFSSATWCNPYREWIGAQIRGDFFGWASPGDPARAAGWAWTDACISHVGNGLYGEMWVAAMLAAAWATDDAEAILRAGLAQVPARSRLAETVAEALTWRREGRLFEEAADAVHARWNENVGHDWCHTLSNAAIVAVGLLWGDMDFEKSVCRAVTCAFDTDCNGATVGSIVGLALGAKRMPPKWTEPLRDRLRTGLHGLEDVRISEMAARSCALAGRLG
jgi:hypothetical protein